MTVTKIKTPFRRELTVENNGPIDTYLQVKGDDWGNLHDVKTYIPQEQVTELVDALLGENATVITDLPVAKEDGYGFVTASGYDRGEHANAEAILERAKALLAIHKFLVEKKAKDAEAEKVKAEEEAKAAEYEAIVKRDKRREELVTDLRGFGNYTSSSHIFQKAIDRIIELEAATV